MILYNYGRDIQLVKYMDVNNLNRTGIDLSFFLILGVFLLLCAMFCCACNRKCNRTTPAEEDKSRGSYDLQITKLDSATRFWTVGVLVYVVNIKMALPKC